MFPTKIQWKLEEVAFEDHKWRLMAKMDTLRDWWSVDQWKKKPVEKTIEKTKWLVLRGMELYHRSINFPFFNLN